VAQLGWATTLVEEIQIRLYQAARAAPEFVARILVASLETA
jgi:hypothetical protein